MSRLLRTVVLAAALLTPAFASQAAAPADKAPVPFDQAQRSDGSKVVPDHFLRRWDPVTVFFDRDTGPKGGGPEDNATKYATLSPDVPGQWQWLSPKVLQFRPSEAWTPLKRITVAAAGHKVELIPLLPTPVSTSPGDDPDGIADLDSFSLTFDDPVDPQALSRLLTIELRPMPGFDGSNSQTLTAQDFTLKAIERSARSSQQTYTVTLKQPVADGMMAILRLKLSDAAGLDDPIFELKLRSAAPFTVTDVTCRSPFAPDTIGDVLRCTPENVGDGETSHPRGLRVRFSNLPQALDALATRGVFRISPPVDDLAAHAEDHALILSGRFQAETVYTLRVDPGTLKDSRGRTLSGPASTTKFVFLADQPALAWDAGQGISERLGPQMIPLRGQGYDHADVRIHKIDPLSRDFWPFPVDGLSSKDDTPPPLPGDEPKHWTDTGKIDTDGMRARIADLGSPPISELVPLPALRGGASAKFGLDLKPLLQKISGADQPGTYLVGLRTVDGTDRHWLRLQVTDLTLTTVEEAGRIHFSVTSLATAKPVKGAEVRLEAVRDDKYVSLAKGTTGADGEFIWTPKAPHGSTELRRIVLIKGSDTLVLDPDNGPAEYAHENWSKPSSGWLSWVAADFSSRQEQPQTLCHVFTERPIYRPEEAVEFRGFVRRYLKGSLSLATGKGDIVLTGPDDQEKRLPVDIDDNGGFYLHYTAKDDATGDYQVHFEAADGTKCGSTTYKRDAYKLPTFEVLLNSADTVPLDRPFPVSLLARYFAGGLLADRPITWRVTQFPYTWTPPGREGFQFSSDSRFSSEHEFKSTPVLQQTGKTDVGGSAQLMLDPTLEPTAQPRSYVVEATVTGDDDMQIRSTQHIVALPPFVLGLKVPRYLPKADAVDPDVLAVDAKGVPEAGVAMTVRLIHRNWNSVLQASDFSQGSAKYVTQVIDETVAEQKITSTADVQHLHFALPGAGVYIVTVEAADKVGRKQSVQVDFFAAGDTPVTWSRPPGQNVTVTTDKPAYAPGETATVVIESPFQTARALAVVEQPEGQFQYDWVDITNGFGRYQVPIRKEQLPKLAVHFLIMRGRLPGPPPPPTAPFDQGKPVTLATTAWIKVTPVENQVAVTITAPPSGTPGQEVEVTLHLADLKGQPLSGEATFWMIDQAVLSLAREQPLDPLPHFIVDRPTKMVARDTRSMAFGVIPLEEVPGGDKASDDWGVENISVRRNFNPLPIYLPHVMIGPDGTATIKVKLPDTLTVYKIRAVVTSGPDRFGFGTGEMKVRQPVIAQPVLPRFARPGDSFDAGLVARVVEGPAGSGSATLKVKGLTMGGPADHAFTWADQHPARVDFPVTVPTGANSAKILMTVQRDADKAGDAVEITLPIHPDRPPVRQDQIVDVAAGASAPLLPAPGDVRPGSYNAAISVAADPLLVRLVAGLNALAEYPFGCTEQKMSLATSELALKPFSPILTAARVNDRVAADVATTITTIKQSIDDDGLVAFWPHSRGSVMLTATAYKFLVAAKAAGLPVEAGLADRLATVLKQALRSDYNRFLGGEDLRERVSALTALAAGGDLEQSYVAELSRRAGEMPLETLAQVTAAVAGLPNADPRQVSGLVDQLWANVTVMNKDGQPVYAGLKDRPASPLILPSETRTLAEVLQAVARATPHEAKLTILRDGLLRLGDSSGWGSTNADAAALQALAIAWAPPGQTTPVPLSITFADGAKSGSLTDKAPVIGWLSSAAGAVSLTNQGSTPVIALASSRYLPIAPGYQATPVENGFVISRTLFKVVSGGPMQKLDPGKDGAVHLAVGDIVEEQDDLISPEDRTQVAIRLPLAAGLEPLNPALATAPAEATPSAGPTVPPTYAAFGDDEVRYFYDSLDKGTVTLRYRLRAQTAGTFTEPPGEAETMYKQGLYGASAGLRVVVDPAAP